MRPSTLRIALHVLCVASTLLSLLPSQNHAWLPTASPFSTKNQRRPNAHAATTKATRPRTVPRLFMTNSVEQPPEDEDNGDDDDSQNDNSQQQQQPLSSAVESTSSDDPKTIPDKGVRLAKAQAEIDRILNHPIDPPFDVETEMKKVISISPPLVAEGSTEYELAEQVSQMEEDLYIAVKAQDFAAAAQKQSELSQLHVDDCGLVLQVNSAFYKAFSDKDVAEMERIWLKDRSCICIHPSFKPLSGIRDIMSTWKRMFESSVGSFQRTWIDPCDIQLTVKATTAIVTCEEHVYARRFVRGKRRESEMVNKLMATNIFRKVGGKWYMTYHHSSWHADSEAAKMALKRGGGGSASGRSRAKPSSQLSQSREDQLRKIGFKLPGSSSNDDDDDQKPTGLESILGLGNAGPLLGDEASKKDDGASSSSKRIILGGPGALGDLMNLLNPRDNISGNSDSDEDDTPGAIIHFSRIEDDGDEEDDDDDDEEEEEDGETFEVIDEEGSDEGEDDSSFSDLQSWVKRTRSQKKNKQVKQQSESIDLRQECIDSLRKLANEGRISPKQKRVLLTDIISCSAQGKSSMVEVAFELLCEGKDPEEFEEEFVDQCQVFAQSLTDPQF